MSDLLNSPLLLSIAFPALTVLGTAPLLRWALSGEKSQTFASLNIGLACMIAIICAYGRPEVMLAFGPAGLPYGVGAISLISLIYCLYLSHSWIRAVLAVLTIVLWCWLLIGGPLNLVALSLVLTPGLVLLLISSVLVFRNRWELQQENTISSLISLSVAAFTLSLLAFSSEMAAAHNFAIALFVIAIGGLILSYPRFGFSFQENALLPLSLCIGTLAWMLWYNGMLPVISLICLGLIFFARPAVYGLVEKGPAWLDKTFYVLLFLFCMLPAFLAVLFYDVLRSL